MPPAGKKRVLQERPTDEVLHFTLSSSTYGYIRLEARLLGWQRPETVVSRWIRMCVRRAASGTTGKTNVPSGTNLESPGKARKARGKENENPGLTRRTPTTTTSFGMAMTTKKLTMLRLATRTHRNLKACDQLEAPWKAPHP